MKLDEAFITNLVSQKIPMINEWLDSLYLELDKHTQSEVSENRQLKSERTGYSFFEDLTRGYIVHHPMSKEYSGDTQYLLGMYLRALKQLTGLDTLHLYNCITTEQEINQAYYHYSSVILGRVYSIYVNTYFPVTAYLRLSHTGEIISDKLNLSRSGAAEPLYLVPTLINIDTSAASLDIQQLRVLEEAKDKISNLVEFVELVIETNLGVDVAVIEIDQLSRMQEKDYIYTRKNPSVGAFYSRYSPKLIEVLTNVAVSEDSNYFIKREALRKYPAKSIADAAKIYLKNFTYDKDDILDKRLWI